MEEQKGFFDEEFRLDDLKKQGDPLIRLNEIINWEMFRPILTRFFRKQPKAPGGRPPFDYIKMFKILVLQRLYNLSDAQMQFQIMDRLSFQRFIGCNLKSKIPDEKTIWLFRENLTKSGLMDRLFGKFQEHLEKNGVIEHRGSIVDASFVEVPRQRNSKKENDQIKKGEKPGDWTPETERQKDIDARWTKKHEQNYFGYKDHIKVDRGSKLITKYQVTPANVHDSQVLIGLLTKKDRHHDLFADSAYSGQKIDKELYRRNIRNRVHEKAYKSRPLTEKQKADNRKKSSIRARVEHVFGFITNSMKGFYIRSIGLVRARFMIGLVNLTYNMMRFVQIQRA